MTQRTRSSPPSSLFPSVDREWSFLYDGGKRIACADEAEARQMARLASGRVEWRTGWRNDHDERLATPAEYCEAFFDWQKAMAENGVMPDVVSALNSLYLPIMKSNYLARRIYGGDAHRVERCPTHEGRWSGCNPEPCEDGCSSGSNVTGWLPARHTFDPWPDDKHAEVSRKYWGWNPAERCRHCGGSQTALVHQTGVAA